MLMLLAAMLVVSDPTVAPQQPEPGAPATAAAAPKKEKKICKNLDGDTGTHMSRRVCKTVEEWTVYDRGGGKSADDMKTMGAR